MVETIGSGIETKDSLRNARTNRYLDDYFAKRARPIHFIGNMLDSFVGQLYEDFPDNYDARLRKQLFDSFPQIIQRFNLGEGGIVTRKLEEEMDRYKINRTRLEDEY